MSEEKQTKETMERYFSDLRYELNKARLLFLGFAHQVGGLEEVYPQARRIFELIYENQKNKSAWISMAALFSVICSILDPDNLLDERNEKIKEMMDQMKAGFRAGDRDDH